ncbi:ImmA/IrrE family metallo-endopeptidase [Muricoccus vinaceus]|uniref:ImmA/IrrE family metallo-endopeptidase n=1 Tax=Muricoccus vinaceus TaxID=424704 RepID=A0ABV6IWT8_9PROT
MDGFDIPIGRTKAERRRSAWVTLGQGFEVLLTFSAGEWVNVAAKAPWGETQFQGSVVVLLEAMTRLWRGLAFADPLVPIEKHLIGWRFCRVGLGVHIAPNGALRGMDHEVVPTDDVLRGIVSLGNQLSARLPVAHLAARGWRDRAPVTPEDIAALDASLLKISAQKYNDLGLVPVGKTDDLIYPDDVRVVARSAASRVAPVALRRMLDEIRRSPPQDTPLLDQVAEHLQQSIVLEVGCAFHEMGHAYALAFRQSRGVLPNQPIDIALVLRDFGVEIRRLSVPEAPDLDAVAAWGSYGPVIVVNTQGRHSRTPEGERASLAHEFGHLLVDRNGSRPVADVRWTNGPKGFNASWEQRANAFAAELLLPRETAVRELARQGDLAKTLEVLCSHYQVSQLLALRQLDNHPEGPGGPTSEQSRDIKHKIRKLSLKASSRSAWTRRGPPPKLTR